MNKKNPRKVTDTERETMKNLYLSGWKMKDIAKKLDRYPDVIRRALIDMRVYDNKTNYMTEEELNSIILDYQKGMTPKELSIKYHRGDGYLINKLKKAGVYQYSTLRISKQQWENIAELYQSGKIDEIWRLYPQLTLSSLYSKMSKMNVRNGTRNYWTDKDREIVKEFYLDSNINDIYELIGYRHTIDAIQTLAFKEFRYSKNKNWSDEEDRILTECYSVLPIEKVLELLPNRTLEGVRNRAKKFRLISNYRISTYWTQEENEFLFNHWQILSDYEISKILNKNEMSIKDRRNLLGLYKTDKSMQKYKKLKKLFRGQIWSWKQKSAEQCNFQCVLTGSSEFHIHHLYGFNDIFVAFVKSNNIISENVDDYSFDELQSLCTMFVEYHNQYPLGVCVRPDLHMLFHDIYGKHNNTPEQWEKFKNDYQNQSIA